MGPCDKQRLTLTRLWVVKYETVYCKQVRYDTCPLGAHDVIHILECTLLHNLAKLHRSKKWGPTVTTYQNYRKLGIRNLATIVEQQVQSRASKTQVLDMFRGFGHIEPHWDQIWAWLPRGHRWAVRIRPPTPPPKFQSLVLVCWSTAIISQIKFRKNEERERETAANPACALKTEGIS